MNALVLLLSLVVTPPISIPADLPDQFHPADIKAMSERLQPWDTDDYKEREAATRRLVTDFGLPPVMIRIAACESNHKPEAHRTSTRRTRAEISGPKPTGDYGLFQINWLTWGSRLLDLDIIQTAADLFDPLTNAAAAEVVLREQGLKAWVCF